MEKVAEIIAMKTEYMVVLTSTLFPNLQCMYQRLTTRSLIRE